MLMSILFSNSVISVRQNRMLTPDRIRRMIAANTQEDAAKILFECGYDDQILTDKPEQTDLIVSTELQRAVSEFGKLCPDAALVYCVRARFVYHNVAAIYNHQQVENSQGRTREREATLMESVYDISMGDMTPQKIRHNISKRIYGVFPDPLSTALTRLDTIESPAPQVVEVEINRALYTDIFQHLKLVKNNVIKQYYMAELDILNMRNFAKARLGGTKPHGLYVEGGKIGEGALMSLFEKNLSGFRTAVIGFGYEQVAASLVESIEASDLTVFENLSGAFLVKIANYDSDDLFKVNMIFAWFMQKLEELRIVKIILIGKKFNKTKDALRDELKGVI